MKINFELQARREVTWKPYYYYTNEPLECTYFGFVFVFVFLLLVLFFRYGIAKNGSYDSLHLCSLSTKSDVLLVSSTWNRSMSIFEMRARITILTWQTKRLIVINLSLPISLSIIIIIIWMSTFFQEQSRVWMGCFPTALSRQSAFSVWSP